ncbi:hypothetical protein TNCV_3563131 [Trichonephila clavipes]|nr:hypothetical protein TNCV_3563131 [Trichonephila clavipes]
MQEFLAHQSERKRKQSETLVDYIYAKFCPFGKSSFYNSTTRPHLTIIRDISEEKWQLALAVQKSNTVEVLIDRETALDAIRSVKLDNRKQSSKPQFIYFSQHD